MSIDFSPFDKQASKTEDWLEDELKKIRSGRVSGAIINDVSVSVYGSQTPLEQLASIGNEGPRTLRVNVYDAEQVDAVKTALQQADLGASIGQDSEGVRLNFPEMTEKNRKQAIQRAKDKREQARVSLREARQEMLQTIEDREADGDISEDDMFRHKETLEEKMQETKSALDEMVEDKREQLEA
jgi:ribosome recycling factor